MPQAKLPDINAALVRYRSLAIEAFQSEDDMSAKLALGNIVALLPENFKVTINTEEYNQKIKEKSFIICPKCKHENLSDDIKRVPVELSNLETFFNSGIRTKTLWKCVKCHHENDVNDSPVVTEKPSMPFYLGVIPEPPERKYNRLWDRLYFVNEFKKWFLLAFAEIESKIGIYRAEYVSQNPDAVDNFGKDEK